MATRSSNSAPTPRPTSWCSATSREPYLRFLPGGEVQENRNSPTTYQNEERYGSDAPDFAQPDADPDWVTVADDGTYAWHDHRAHWMQPIRPAGKAPGDRIVEQVIPLVVDGARGRRDGDLDVAGRTVDDPGGPRCGDRRDLASAAPSGCHDEARRGPLRSFRSRRSPTIAGWWQYTSLPSETGPRIIWALLPSIALVASLAAIALGRRAPFAAVAAGLVAASQLAIWAFVKRDGLTAAIVPTDAPQWFERLSLTAAFVVGVGGVAIAVFQLFSGTSGNQAGDRDDLNVVNIPTTSLKRRSIALAAVAVLGLAACGSDDDTASGDDTEQAASAADVTIADPWSRQPADGQTTSAVYGELTNNTDETITAISATASVSDTVELHEVLMNDEGQMSMQEKEGGYEIAAGETFVFEPGGPHIMLLDIDAATYPDTRRRHAVVRQRHHDRVRRRGARDRRRTQ